MAKQYYHILLFFCVLLAHAALAQNGAPGILWQKTIGGSNQDVLTGMAVGADKSVVLCGYSNSAVSGNKSNSSFGSYDYWVVKLDAAGNVLWNKTYGGNDDDFAYAIINTSDGGYLLGGSSVSDISGSKTANSIDHSYDYWVLKLDANGNKVWDKTMGGTYIEWLSGLAELPNGIYVVGGYSYSDKDGTKKLATKGLTIKADFWTVLLNKDGTEKSQYVFGGGSHDVVSCVSPAGVSSFYVAGYTYSFQGSGKTKKLFGNNDYYIIRSNMAGKIEYEGDFGGTRSNYLTCMQALPDSSLILGGYSNSPKSGSKTENFFGVNDFWLVKLKRDGTKQWDKTFSGGTGNGSGGDYLVSVQQTKDKGFILGGYSNATAGRSKTEGSRGDYDYWIVKTDSLGKVQWNKTIGGNGKDVLTAVYELDSNQYIVAGTSASALSGDKTSGTVGGGAATDYWIVRLGTAQGNTSRIAATPTAEDSRYMLEVMPNPVKEVLTVKYRATTTNSKADMVIYDANGKAVLQASLSVSNRENMQSFSVAHLPAGAYFAVLYIGDVKLAKAFTKE